MTILIDTHVLLFWQGAPDRLSSRAHRVVTDGRNRLLWSVASSWELAIKVALGKLRLPEPIDTFIPSRLSANGIEVLPIELRHAHRVAELPHVHRDPFDRLLVAQAELEGVPVLTSDAKMFRRYRVECIW